MRLARNSSSHAATLPLRLLAVEPGQRGCIAQRPDVRAGTWHTQADHCLLPIQSLFSNTITQWACGLFLRQPSRAPFRASSIVLYPYPSNM
jgi:hypothetical protein